MPDTLQVIVGACLAILGLGTAVIGIHCTRGNTDAISVTIEGQGPVSGEVCIMARDESVADA